MERWVVLLGGLVVMAGCVGLRPAAKSGEVVRAYVVHHGEPTWNRLFAEFERGTGCKVNVAFACRGVSLVDQAVDGKDGDLFITDAADNVKELGEKGLS